MTKRESSPLRRSFIEVTRSRLVRMTKRRRVCACAARAAWADSVLEVESESFDDLTLGEVAVPAYHRFMVCRSGERPGAREFVGFFTIVSAMALTMASPEVAWAAKTKKKAEPPAAEPAPPPQEEEPAPIEEPAPEPTKAESSAAVSTDASEVSTTSAPTGTREFLLFLEGGFRYDLGNFSRRENVGRNETTNNDSVSTVDPMFHLGFLKRLDDSFRMGAAFGYGGNFSAGNNQLLGQLLTLDWRIEGSVRVEEKLWLIATPKLGAQVLIPGGLLQDRISENQRFGYDTWSGPRYGFLVGVDAGVRYQVNDWFSLRGTVGYAWGMFFLLDSSASSEFVSASQTWQLQSSRLSGNVGIEVSF